jgi:hypothetical protein
MDEIQIYPAFNARYYSPYLEGLRAMAGQSKLRFTARSFPAFGTDCLAIRIGRPERNIYIHSNDMPELDPRGLAWCDVFGKVNLDPSLIPAEAAAKVLAIGPMFAMRVWGPGGAEVRALANFARSRHAIPSFQQHLANYRGQYRSRFAEGAYRPTSPQPGYVFFNAALWEREPEANALRARFIDAARSVSGVTFEGGLSPRNSARGAKEFRAPAFEHYICRRYSAREYLEKTRQSVVVLNNPAYRDCHSWRLAEYLALGKAIISTPIVRALPAPLVHGTHIHYVDGSADALRHAIATLCADHEYRHVLEENARAYYEAYLAPSSVVRRVLHHAGMDLGPAKAPRPGRTAGPPVAAVWLR